MDSFFDFVFGAIDLFKNATESPVKVVHSIDLRLAFCCYCGVTLAMSRRATVSAWLPIIALVPAVVILSGLAANLMGLMFFVVTLGGDPTPAIPEVRATCAVGLAAIAALGASSAPGGVLRKVCLAAAGFVLIWILLHNADH